MEQIKVKCPNCENEMEVYPNAGSVKCKYCNRDIVVGNNAITSSKSTIILIVVFVIIVVGMLIFLNTKNKLINMMRYNINTSNENKTNIDNTREEESTSNIDSDLVYNYNAKLSDVTKEKGKVNIYIFWGDGCPHCSEAHAFFDSIKASYSKYFNLYGFEVWYNDDNNELFKTFADAKKDEAQGVPYIIIGNKSFLGYVSEWDGEIKDAIKSEANKGFDIYLDVIKKEG